MAVGHDVYLWCTRICVFLLGKPSKAWRCLSSRPLRKIVSQQPSGIDWDRGCQTRAITTSRRGVLAVYLSETGRMWIRRARFQTLSSVSFSASPSSRERTQWASLSLLLLCVCQSELTEFVAEITEFPAKLSEFSSPKQYSRNSSGEKGR